MIRPLERTLVWSTALTVALFSAGVGCSSSAADGGSDTGGSGGTSTSGGTGASGGTSGTQGLGGSGGTGGTGGSGTPNPPAAGFSITLTEPSPTDGVELVGRTCNVGVDGSVVYTIGAPAPGETVPDGTDGVTVDCSVGLGSDGSSMDVVAAVGGPDTVTSEAISFSVESTMIQSRDSTPAFITFDSDTRGHLSPVSACTLGPFATLKSGAMLADFTCSLGSPDDATVGCKAHGTIGVEYCQTGN